MSEDAGYRSHHRLLVPADLELTPFIRDHLVKAGWVEDRTYLHSHDSLAMKPGPLHFTWQSLTPLEIDQKASEKCFWEFLRLPGKEAPEVFDFVRRWGVAQYWMHSDEDWERPSLIPVDGVQTVAWDIRRMLLILTATEAGELVEEEALLIYPDLPSESEGASHLEWLDEVRAERRAGRGIRLQQDVAKSVFARQPVRRGPDLVWDVMGHRFEQPADGIFDIAWAHVCRLYSTVRSDLYICSSCRNPFQFDEASGGRRPRRGVKTYCSDECRTVGRRESNRASWSKNGARWRASRRAAKGD